MKLIGIKYVGLKSRPQPDTVAGTNLVWLDTAQVHYVTESVAFKLLKHPDVWAQVGTKEGTPETPDPIVAPKQTEIEPPPLVPLDTMDAQAMIVYAKTQFGQYLHPSTKPENMRAKIRNWMNSPMATGQ